MATIPAALAVAIQHHQAGRLAEAEQIYRQILAAEPSQPDAWHLLGLVAHRAGKHQAAAEHIRRSIELRGTVAAVHHDLGAVYRALGRTPEAVACYRRALELKPDFAEVHYNLGEALQVQAKLEEAAACYRRALEYKPGLVEAYSNLGAVLQHRGSLDEAVACYRRALELRPGYATVHNNLGNALKDQGRLDEAVACCRRALELKPDFAEAHCNLGDALRYQGKLDEAVACCRRALELKPRFAEAHNSLGYALYEQGKLNEAEARYRQALELDPCLAHSHEGLAGLQLLRGDFRRGWPGLEWRLQARPIPPRLFRQSLWDGGDLAGRTILLYAEHGLGDAIHFVRYAPLVKRLGGTVIVECQKSLVPLLTTCAGIDQLIGRGDEIPEFAAQAPLMSLPGIFQTSLDTIPAAVPYLFADRVLIESWRERLRTAPGYKVGLNWQGAPGPTSRVREIPLKQFAAVAEIPGVRLIRLQKGTGAEELAHAPPPFPVCGLGDELDQANGAFMDTAAIMMNLDLVITSDTALAHLAGALGVPVWVALPFAPDWRWLLERADSPWYPTMRLFRQKAPGDWAAVFSEIATQLRERVLMARAADS